MRETQLCLAKSAAARVSKPAPSTVVSSASAAAADDARRHPMGMPCRARHQTPRLKPHRDPQPATSAAAIHSLLIDPRSKSMYIIRAVWPALTFALPDDHYWMSPPQKSKSLRASLARSPECAAARHTHRSYSLSAPPRSNTHRASGRLLQPASASQPASQPSNRRQPATAASPSTSSSHPPSHPTPPRRSAK